MLRTVHLAVLCAILTGCAGASSDRDDGGEASALVAPASDSQQVMPYLDESIRAAVVPAFRARNGNEWKPSSDQVILQADLLTGAVETMWKTGTPGPADPTLTGERAAVVARAFVQKNLDLLKLVPSDLETARVTIHNMPEHSFRVEFFGGRVQPGYEAFDELHEQTMVTVAVDHDGTAVGLINWCHHLQKLTLSTKPELAAGDPRVIEKVLGRELEGSIPAFVDPPPPVPLGKVETGDIQSKRVVVFSEYGETARTLTLAYEIVVQKGDFSFLFAVNAANGDVLEFRQL
jgi:hypothetical protein